MYFVGCDLGSTTGKAVFLEESPDGLKMVSWGIVPSGLSPDETTNLVLDEACGKLDCDRDAITSICCTGYGRENVSFIKDNISEITCHARGAHFLMPSVRTVIDVGGQDVKTIALGKTGRVMDFAMNDKCAAGTGRFFEGMARTLRVSVEELGAMALQSDNPVPISSTCSVFAESEVITYINKGAQRCDISAGIHESIARRLFAMTQRVGLSEDVVLTGGCAKNPGLRAAVERILGVTLKDLPCDPQINGALGAALYAHDAWLEDAPKDVVMPPDEQQHIISSRGCEGCEA